MRAVRFVVLLFGLVCGPLLTAASAADKFPTRPIKFVVGFLAGGPNDIIARIFCDWLQPHLGQPCVVENKAGQGGMIAAKSVIDSPPDGYTIMFVAPNNAIGQTLYKSLPFNHVRDTTPIAGTMKLANIMVVPPDLPVKTVAEFIAHAKANPGRINMGSAGIGSTGHLAGELFKMMAGVDMIHVPYRGNAPALTDLIAGQIEVLFPSLGSSIAYVKAGRLRALAVTDATRSDALPDVPPVAETLPGYQAASFYGIGAPRNTPAEIVEVLNNAVNAGLADPKLKARLTDLGSVLLPGPPARFGQLIADETEKWGKVIRFAGLKAQ